MSDEIILDTDAAAAKQVTVTGWVSRDGIFCGNSPSSEATARYAGCTHRACQACGKPAPKSYTKCDECRSNADIERYNALPTEKWDGAGMLAIWHSDTYFNDWDEVADYCDEHGEKEDDLMLVICEPNYIKEIDYDYAHDELSVDGENPDELNDAIAKFNEAIKKIPAVSYSSYGKLKAVLLDSESVSVPQLNEVP